MTKYKDFTFSFTLELVDDCDDLLTANGRGARDVLHRAAVRVAGELGCPLDEVASTATITSAPPPAAVTIKTEFLSPTLSQGSRFRAWSTAPRRTITQPRDYELTAPEAHRSAAQAIADKLGLGEVSRAPATTPTGYTFTAGGA